MSEGAADLDMLPDQTGRVLDGIERPMAAWRTDWSQRSKAIEAEEKAVQTGFDDVSVNFRTSYNAVAPQLMDEIPKLAPRVITAVSTGRTIVARYVETFQQASDNLQL